MGEDGEEARKEAGVRDWRSGLVDGDHDPALSTRGISDYHKSNLPIVFCP